MLLSSFVTDFLLPSNLRFRSMLDCMRKCVAKLASIYSIFARCSVAQTDGSEGPSWVWRLQVAAVSKGPRRHTISHLSVFLFFLEKGSGGWCCWESGRDGTDFKVNKAAMCRRLAPILLGPRITTWHYRAFTLD